MKDKVKGLTWGPSEVDRGGDGKDGGHRGLHLRRGRGIGGEAPVQPTNYVQQPLLVVVTLQLLLM